MLSSHSQQALKAQGEIFKMIGSKSPAQKQVMTFFSDSIMLICSVAYFFFHPIQRTIRLWYTTQRLFFPIIWMIIMAIVLREI